MWASAAAHTACISMLSITLCCAWAEPPRAATVSARRPALIASPGFRSDSLRLFPGFRTSFRQVPHPRDKALTFGRRDDTASVEQVEDVRRLERLFVGWKRQRLGQRQQFLA